MTLGWFGVGGVVSGDGKPNHHHHHHQHSAAAFSPPGSNALASAGIGGVGGFGRRQGHALRLFGGHATLDEEGEERSSPRRPRTSCTFSSSTTRRRSAWPCIITFSKRPAAALAA